MSAPALLALWLALQASSGASLPAPAPPPAEAAVQRFFAAISAGDCAALRTLTTRAQWRDRCSEAVDEMKGHQVRLLGIEGSAPDGRAPRIQLVRTRVEHNGREHLWLLSVEPAPDGGWRLVI